MVSEENLRRSRPSCSDDNSFQTRTNTAVFQSSTSDVISGLPSNITENILVRMPLKDAVRTSVLSMAWRHKWAKLSGLWFDEFFKESLVKEELSAIIYQVLLLHSGPLVRFKLSVSQFSSCTDLNNWFLILQRKSIQEIILLFSQGPHLKLPFYLFSFLHLRHLHLKLCVFELPPTFKGFSKLVLLYLLNVQLVPETFGTFISNCPQLERLILIRCTGFDCLEISAPNLEYFYFNGFFRSIYFRNTTNLAEISLLLGCFDANNELPEGGKDSNLLKFLSDVPDLEKLFLNDNILKLLAVGGVPKSLPSPLNCLETLELRVYFDVIDEVSCALCLIRSSPNLRKLRIRFHNEKEDLGAVRDLLHAQDLSKIHLNTLCEVDLLDLSGVEPELLFLKFLLACSPTLEKMKIWPVKEKASEEVVQILKEMIRFPRASPKAELIYH